MTPNKDATVWTIRLRSGVTFHNGKDVTADDLIFSINRVINPKSPGEAANALHGINASGMKKVDNLTITVPFAQAVLDLSREPGQQHHRLRASGRVRPQEADRHRSVQDVPASPPASRRSSPATRTTGTRRCLTSNEIIMTDYADETSQVNALLERPGGRHQPALAGHASGPSPARARRWSSPPVVAGTRSRCGSISRRSTTCGSGRRSGWPSTARRCWRPCSAATARSATTSSRSGPRSMTTAFRSASTTPSRPSRCSRPPATRTSRSRWSRATSRRG